MGEGEGNRLEEVLAVVRSSGGRITSARRAIVGALADHSEHPTVEQLTTAVQARQPDVHESTVYRFLEELERLGVVDHVHLGHGPAVYHFTADSHHHLVCEACGLVVEVPDPTFEDVRRRLRTEFDFELKPRHFALPGRCRDCSEPAPTAAS